MKINLLIRTTIASLFLGLLISCESHEKMADEAFDRFKQGKMAIKDSIGFMEEAKLGQQKAENKSKTEPLDEWLQFKQEMEKKISSNEKRIKELKGTAYASTSLSKKISGLERENNDLRKEMDVYKEEVKLSWENFKMKMNHDVNGIGIELKDMSVNSKK